MRGFRCAFPLIVLVLAGASCVTRGPDVKQESPPGLVKLDGQVIPVAPIPNSVRREFGLDPFYQKYVSLCGFPVVASTNVSDAAVRETAWVVGHMMEGREDILRVLASNHVRLAVMAWNEFTTDLPEERHLTPRVFWNNRSRGITHGTLVCCAEENLLDYPGDGFRSECVIIHEFGHVIEQQALRVIDPTFHDRLVATYKAALSNGLWKGTYAAKNQDEYWAEGVKNWYDHGRTNDAQNNHVHTREGLKAYDPALAKLCKEILGDGIWRYRKPRLRDAAGLTHLGGYDAAKAPRFKWRVEPVPEKPVIQILTTMGDIEVELFRQQAPLTVTNFMSYVDKLLYTDGTLSRTVTASNAPPGTVQVVANRARKHEFPSPVALENTRDTGLRHLDGSLSMPRGTSGSGTTDSFFICIGDMPELDCGGKGNPDGQEFAVFGKVVKGMDVVRKIQNLPADARNLPPSLRIPQIIRLN